MAKVKELRELWDELWRQRKEAREENSEEKKRAYKKARDEQYTKQFTEEYSDYAEQIDKSERLRSFPIKRIIAPFYMHESLGKKGIDPLNILPHKPKNEEEFNALFYSSQNKKQVATVLGVVGFDLLAILAFTPIIPKLTCAGLVTVYGIYTMYERSLETPSKYTYKPYTLEKIIDGVEKLNLSSVGIAYPNCSNRCKSYRSIIEKQRIKETKNERQ